MKTKISLLSAIAICLAIASCKKKEVIKVEEKIVYVDNTPAPVQQETGTVELIFEPVLNGSAYTMSTSFNTPAGENLKVTDFKFYVSGIGLASDNSKENKALPYPGDQEQSGIYLANFTAPNFNNGNGLNSHKLRFKGVVGEYSDIRFRMEVPSDYNLANITTNPYPCNASNGMYWSWNSGFKYLVINGTSTNVPNGGAVHLSIGADKNCVFNFRSLILAPNLPKIKIEKNKVTQIRFTYDLMAMFRNTDGSNYSFISGNPSVNNAQVHGGANANVLRGNIQQALELVSFTNPQ
jgi:hypothetical protein